MSNLIIPVGIPGCGKSTWATSILGSDYEIVSSDEIRKVLYGTLKEAHNPEFKKERNEIVWYTFYGKIEDLLARGTNVFADATNLNDYARKRLREIAARTDADIHILLFENVYEAGFRNRQRAEDQIVPDEVMTPMESLFYAAIEDIIDNEVYDSVTRIAGVR